MELFFKYKRELAKRYSIGKTLETMGAQMGFTEPEGGRKLIPALRKMFFNCFVMVTPETSYEFNGGHWNFTHSDFVKLYKFAMENTAEMDTFITCESNARRILEWTQQEPLTCHFTDNKTRAYRIGGRNTFYLMDGELKTARGLVIANNITRGMSRCGKCDKYVIEFYEGMARDTDDRKFCPECAKDFSECVSCGHMTLNHKCGRCSEFYDRINSYGSRPLKFWFFDKVKGKLIKDSAEKSGINSRVKAFYMGDEHEIENGGYEQATENALDVLNSYNDELFYATEDSTLSRGFELHTHPSTHKAHAGREWGGLAYLRDNGGKSYRTNTAGLHIHLNRNAFTNWHFLKFLKFLMDNIALSLAVGRRRNMDNLNDYARFDFAFFHNVKKRIVRDMRDGHKPNHPTVAVGSRGAINLQNSRTIELRFMGGSLEESKYKAKIDFIQAVYEYTAHGSYTRQNAREFVNFVQDRKNRFRHLVSELKTDVFKRAVKFPKETPSNLTY